MASGKCTSWWRITGGRISVPSSLSAIGLWRATRTTRWADWRAVRFTSAGTLEDVQMTARQRRRAIQRVVLWTAIAVVGGYTANSVNALAYIRQTLDL